MPDPCDRHGRGSWDYPGSQPPRSQQRAAAAQEPAKRPPAKKDPDLCKGRHWKGPHTPEIQFTRWKFQKKCGWAIWGWRDREPQWSCGHVDICSGCGKDFGSISKERCPDFHEVTPEEQVSLDEELRKSDERMASWRMRRKPPITGPQGYRRKRDD